MQSLRPCDFRLWCIKPAVNNAVVWGRIATEAATRCSNNCSGWRKASPGFGAESKNWGAEIETMKVSIGRRVGRGYPLPAGGYPSSGKRVKGSVVSSPDWSGAKPRSKTKTTLVLSKRDRTSVVADFTHLQSVFNREPYRRNDAFSLFGPPSTPTSLHQL